MLLKSGILDAFCCNCRAIGAMFGSASRSLPRKYVAIQSGLAVWSEALGGRKHQLIGAITNLKLTETATDGENSFLIVVHFQH